MFWFCLWFHTQTLQRRAFLEEETRLVKNRIQNGGSWLTLILRGSCPAEQTVGCREGRQVKNIWNHHPSRPSHQTSNLCENHCFRRYHTVSNIQLKADTCPLGPWGTAMLLNHVQQGTLAIFKVIGNPSLEDLFFYTPAHFLKSFCLY